jgi:hypothetical protein
VEHGLDERLHLSAQGLIPGIGGPGEIEGADSRFEVVE